MNRAERRRQAKELSKSKMPLPLNVALPVEGAADITGQEAVALKTYLELKEKEIRENVTAALMKEAQEKLTRAEDYIAIINILIILYATIVLILMADDCTLVRLPLFKWLLIL